MDAQVQDTQFCMLSVLFTYCMYWSTVPVSAVHLAFRKKLPAYLSICKHMCECLCACLWSTTVLKNARIKPQEMEGTPHLPPTEKVKLFNINSGSGHHADYATITILHTASMDHLHPHTPHLHTLFTLPGLARPFGIKTHWERALLAPHADIHKHILTLTSTITVFYEGLKPRALRDPDSLCYNTQRKYKLIW